MPQKKGWFSRKKKSSSGAPGANVVRPPSSTSFGSSRRQASSTSNAPTADDDLPPRVEKDDIPTSEAMPPPISDESGSRRPSVDIPKHAGFDLHAMKEILGNATTHPEELKIPTPGQATNHLAHPIPLPSHRSESAPPLDQDNSPATTPAMKSSLRLLPQANATRKSPSDADLRTAFERSVSVENAPRAQPERAVSSHLHPILQQERTASTSQRPAPLLTGFSAPWASEPTSKNGSQVFGQRSFGPSTEILSFEGADGSVAPFGNPFNASQNPFASPAAFTPPSSAGISFGSTDGSITFSPSSETAEQDPWTYRPPRSSSLNSNPWDS